MENSAILVEHVTKKFGTETVLEDVCLRVKQGSICGIVGRNGSGKTVLFKCICGLLHTNSGNIQVDRAQIGAIIEEPGFLKQYSGKKNLKLLASLSDKPHKDFDELLALVGLSSAGQKLSLIHIFFQRNRQNLLKPFLWLILKYLITGVCFFLPDVVCSHGDT